MEERTMSTTFEKIAYCEDATEIAALAKQAAEEDSTEVHIEAYALGVVSAVLSTRNRQVRKLKETFGTT
jgi:hypothetical protein